jgi:hypothetical protein
MGEDDGGPVAGDEADQSVARGVEPGAALRRSTRQRAGSNHLLQQTAHANTALRVTRLSPREAAAERFHSRKKPVMRWSSFLVVVVILTLGCARELTAPSTPAHNEATKPSTVEKGAAGKMDEIKETIKLSGFDLEGEPVIRVMGDGSLLIVFNFMPPSFVPDGAGMGPFADFDKQLERAAGVPVVWDDREVFVIQKPKRDTVKKLQKFLEGYRKK